MMLLESLSRYWARQIQDYLSLIIQSQKPVNLLDAAITMETLGSSQPISIIAINAWLGPERYRGTVRGPSA